MAKDSGSGRIFAFDLGTTSVGWAVLRDSEGGAPSALIDAGVRIFDAGVEGQIEQGRDEARNVKRRLSRAQRRQLWRRRRRRSKLYRTLMDAGLLPRLVRTRSAEIHEAIGEVDRELLASSGSTGLDRQRLPYALRASALDRPLTAHELGRALYHLGHRRGYLSNRKDAPKPDEDKGKVESAITELDHHIQITQSRTLGEFLFRHVDPNVSARRRWTSRAMYIREFLAIRDSQRLHHPSVTDAQWKAIQQAIFQQRRLRVPAALIGRCGLLPELARAPKASFEYQQFRLLSVVNNLRVIDVGTGETRTLTADERDRLTRALSRAGSMRFTAVRTLLKLKGTKFNTEIDGGETQIPGDRTSADLARVFGDRWESMPEADRAAVLRDVWSFEKDEALARRGRKRWGLSDESASAFSAVRLESGYAPFSLAALRRLVPHLQAGLNVEEAKRLEFPHLHQPKQQYDFLPPVDSVVRNLRNPVVHRTLSELRAVMNELIRAFGKPARVRVEVARDLKRSRYERERKWRDMRDRERTRDAAVARLLNDAKVVNPTRADIEKCLLFEECGGVCPYTGKSINFASLFGPHPQFDVEHIIPRSRSLDDSFANKTLCDVEFNRSVKQNRTPFEALGGSAEWSDVLARAKRFVGVFAAEKQRRFKLEDGAEAILAQFASRQLNDTRFASRMAAEYIALLFGGLQVDDQERFVQVSAGGVTAELRRRLRLGAVLGGGDKVRSDHRHHAIDAVVIGLVTPRMVQEIASFARQRELGRLSGAGVRSDLALPWPSLIEDVRACMERLVVSHRPNRRLRGSLHQETNYGAEIAPGRRRQRVPLARLSRADVADIIDPVVRQKVAERIGELDPKKVFVDDKNLPRLGDPSKGRVIRRVRIASAVTAVQVGRGAPRFVAPGSNHHMAVRETVDGKGRPVWRGEVVTRLEAHVRHNSGAAVIDRQTNSANKHLFTISSGDMLRLTIDGRVDYFVVASVSGAQIELRLHRDARPATAIRQGGKAGGRVRMGVDALRSADAERVAVTPAGRVRRSRE